MTRAPHPGSYAAFNRFHQYDWQCGAPYPGEREYLAGCKTVTRIMTRVSVPADTTLTVVTTEFDK